METRKVAQNGRCRNAQATTSATCRWWTGTPPRARKRRHGYLHEGDAQRDAWQILADLLVDDSLAPTARAGQAAQVRLAPRQPDAYREFGHASSDRQRWASADLEEPGHWVVRPSGRLLPLTREPVIEVPVDTAAARIIGIPVVGDRIFLLGEELIVGAWVVVARTAAPVLLHPADASAIRSAEEKHRGGARDWLHLRPEADLWAAEDVPVGLDLARNTVMIAKPITGADFALLRETVTTPAQILLERTAERLRQEDRKLAAELQALSGQEVTGQMPGLTDQDPFVDAGI